MKRVCAAVLSLSLTGCVPWTVRPIEDQSATASKERFDVVRFVDSVWQPKLLPAIESSAVELKSVLATGPLKAGAHVMVKSTARVLRVNTTPPSGLMTLDLEPYDGRADAVLQIGPELRGSSLRDATRLIQFSHFVNQIDFANASSELNRRALRCLPPTSELAKAMGRTIVFTGTFTADGDMPHIVPVRFRWVEGAK